MKDLKELLERFMNLDKAKDKNKTSKVSRDDPDWQLFQERGGEADNFFKNKFIREKNYKFYGKLGQLNFPYAYVYYMAIVNKKKYANGYQNKITKGRYVAYLLSEDHNKLFLCFMIGVSKAQDIEGTVQAIKNCIGDEIKKYHFSEGLDSGELGKSESAQEYSKGTICYKRYEKNNLPDNAELEKDLNDMLELYQFFEDNYIDSNGEVIRIPKKKMK